MKAPQNFTQKIKGHKLIVCGMEYELGDSFGVDNKLWLYVYRKNKSTNAILMEFNWEKQFYTIKVAKINDGENFHTILPPFDFIRTTHFLSFSAFNSWMIAKIQDLHKYFEFK